MATPEWPDGPRNATMAAGRVTPATGTRSGFAREDWVCDLCHGAIRRGDRVYLSNDGETAFDYTHIGERFDVTINAGLRIEPTCELRDDGEDLGVVLSNGEIADVSLCHSVRPAGMSIEEREFWDAEERVLSAMRVGQPDAIIRASASLALLTVWTCSCGGTRTERRILRRPSATAATDADKWDRDLARKLRRSDPPPTNIERMDSL